MRAAWAGLFLAGCVAAEPPAPAGLPGLSLVPAADGLTVDGSGGRQIAFGRARTGVLESIARIEGQRPEPVACGGGRSAWVTQSGLLLVFDPGGTDDARFAGWQGGGTRAGRTCA
ncbi:hypothetical protein [Jannaschia sp. M317]|uniref:hypothetical protein n=1 Tax=Jannaschia sp. M317 TaxID=2867011 RepID=UPI0021A7DB51|nr:hypothetical protein [Jannaschia sp. M317]UWQ18523.1 hypothetical protein K3551_04280 [Jannaschia sp. M317]